MNELKCCICGKPTTLTCCSITNTTLAFCEEHIDSGIIPYGELVSLGCYFNDLNEDVAKNVALPTLEHYGKSVDDFDWDVSEFFLEEMNYHSSGNTYFYEDDDFDDGYYWDPYDNS